MRSLKPVLSRVKQLADRTQPPSGDMIERVATILNEARRRLSEGLPRVDPEWYALSDEALRARWGMSPLTERLIGARNRLIAAGRVGVAQSAQAVGPEIR